MNDNNIVYQARLHWILFLGPFMLLCLSAWIIFAFEQLYVVALFLAGFSVVWGLTFLMTYHFSSLTIKKNQVILRTGFLVQKTLDIPLSKIESIDIRQTLIGSLLQYGTLVITGTGGSRQMVNYLSQPLTCRRYIEQLMHE